MLFFEKIVISLSLLAVGVAAGPLEKRAYSSELKQSIETIGVHWEKILKLVDLIPSKNGTGVRPETTQPLTQALKELGDHLSYVVNEPLQTNGAFTNIKWAQEYVDDIRRNGPTAVKAMRVIVDRAPQVQDIGRAALLGTFTTVVSSVAWGYGNLWDLNNRVLLQFVKDEIKGSEPSPNQLDGVNEANILYPAEYRKAFWDEIINPPKPTP